MSNPTDLSEKSEILIGKSDSTGNMCPSGQRKVSQCNSYWQLTYLKEPLLVNGDWNSRHSFTCNPTEATFILAHQKHFTIITIYYYYLNPKSGIHFSVPLRVAGRANPATAYNGVATGAPSVLQNECVSLYASWCSFEPRFLAWRAQE